MTTGRARVVLFPVQPGQMVLDVPRGTRVLAASVDPGPAALGHLFPGTNLDLVIWEPDQYNGRARVTLTLRYAGMDTPDPDGYLALARIPELIGPTTPLLVFYQIEDIN